MGASGWGYTVAYEPDFEAALQRLRNKVFAEGDYYWFHEDEFIPEDERRPKPATMEELFTDPEVQECGTHSILDVFGMTGPGEQPDYGLVHPVSAEEAREHIGTDRPTRAHIEALDDNIPLQRWFGRCAVLYGDGGEPEEIYFFGYSGD
jgi:hypothetical protein